MTRRHDPDRPAVHQLEQSSPSGHRYGPVATVGLVGIDEADRLVQEERHRTVRRQRSLEPAVVFVLDEAIHVGADQAPLAEVDAGVRSPASTGRRRDDRRCGLADEATHVVVARDGVQREAGMVARIPAANACSSSSSGSSAMMSPVCTTRSGGSRGQAAARPGRWAPPTPGGGRGECRRSARPAAARARRPCRLLLVEDPQRGSGSRMTAGSTSTCQTARVPGS